MSVEEEIELRDLVAQTLETNGCLAKIRAQLRASIFLALDEDAEISKQQPFINNKVKTYLETEEGKLMFCVVREFLEFFNLYFSLSVFDPESNVGNGYKYESRENVAKDLGLDNTDENTTVPLLLQLIKIAQPKSKSLEINLKMNKDDLEENKLIHNNSSSNLIKTDSNNVPLDETSIHLDSENLLIENLAPVPAQLNATFDLSSPTVNFNIVKKGENAKLLTAQIDVDSKDQILDSTYNKKEEKDDDTYGDTSSIAEDSIALVNSESNVTVPQLTLNGLGCNMLSEFVNDTEILQPILKESKTMDKPKSSQKPDKLKSKNSLSTLSDLPPLQMNKSRVNDILPSLYSKEFKDKSNLRELDKLFDMEADYEEDFICSGDDLSLKSEYIKSDHTKSNILDDLPQSNKSTSSDKSVSSKRDLKPKVPNRMISDCNKQIFKPLVSGSKTTDVLKSIDTANKSEVGSNSVNDNLDFNNSD